MTSLLEGASNVAARGTEIGARVKGLDAAVGAARGRLDDALLAPAAEVVAKAAERLRLSADHTVVALGGATGSGKSSTFNALVGLELSSVGVRRPTTSWATACTWGSNGAADLLEWLGIPARHQVVRDSMLDSARQDKDPASLHGLVMLDLPDHDSTEVAHHLEVERLVRLADLLIWVLDPQKYADAAIHDRFLRPLAAHKAVMLIVLNHIDEVAEDRRAGMVADLRRLLDADGLEGITVIATSARKDIGIDELRSTIAARVAEKAATRDRIATNLSEIAGALARVSGNAVPPAVSEQDRTELSRALAAAAGVPAVVHAVESVTLAEARKATGWPLVSWMSRFGDDPFASLDLGMSSRDFVAKARATTPGQGKVAEARVDTAVRALSDRLSGSLTRPWATAMNHAAVSRLPEVTDRLERGLVGTDLGDLKAPAWTQLMRALQWLLLFAGLGGAAWLAAGLGHVTEPKVASVPIAALLLGAGIVLGPLLALGCRAAGAASAKTRAEGIDAGLRGTVNKVAEELVLAPLQTELDAYRMTTEGLRAALA